MLREPPLSVAAPKTAPAATADEGTAFAFSDLPIRMLMGGGVLGLIVPVALGVAVLTMKMAWDIDVPGYAATMLTITFFGALNMVGLGIIRGYVWRAFENTKARPVLIISSRIEHAASSRHP